nr:hypothetical protein [Methylobacterium durans]
MGLHHRVADTEPEGDLLVDQSTLDQGEHVHLRGRQRADAQSGGFDAVVGMRAALDRRRHEDVPVHDALDRLQVGRLPRRFRHEAGRAELQRLPDDAGSTASP